MPRPSVNRFYMSLLDTYATRSTCPRRQVACLITTRGNVIVGTGFNGVPSGVPHCNEGHPCPGVDDPSGDSSRCRAIHSEINALLQCWRLDLAYNMYVHSTPCFSCAKAICNTLIQRIFYFDVYPDPRGLELIMDSGRDLIKIERDGKD